MFNCGKQEAAKLLGVLVVSVMGAVLSVEKVVIILLSVWHLQCV